MTQREKRLYHQIHPVKLATDFGTAFVATVLLWTHDLILAIVVGVIPSIIVSVVIVTAADLEQRKASSFGRYTKEYMDSRIVDGVRLTGFLIMAIGGWWHLVWGILFGFLVVVICWTRGLIFPKA